jgi:hypothetical protein
MATNSAQRPPGRRLVITGMTAARGLTVLGLIFSLVMVIVGLCSPQGFDSDVSSYLGIGSALALFLLVDVLSRLQRGADKPHDDAPTAEPPR